MFTGLVEETGEILKVEEGPFLRVYIGARKVLEDLKVGDSVAVDGACLTAVAVEEGVLGGARPGDPAPHRPHLAGGAQAQPGAGPEGGGQAWGALRHRARGRGGEALGGPRGPRGQGLLLPPPKALAPYIAEKGSVALNGVSLTVAGLTGEAFWVTLIPHTLEVTNLGRLRVGDGVNLEVDLIARYVARLLGRA